MVRHVEVAVLRETSQSNEDTALSIMENTYVHIFVLHILSAFLECFSHIHPHIGDLVGSHHHNGRDYYSLE